MSYYDPVAAAGPRTRPGAVSAAGYLLYTVAALFLVSVVVGLSTAGKTLRATKDVLQQTSNRDATTAIKAGLFVGIGVDIVVVVVFVLMAVYVLKGSNAWRITAWVIAGLGVLCTLCGIGGAGISRVSSGNLTSAQTQELKDAVPAWVRDGQIAVNVLIAIALIAIIILLALPAANDFFRRPAFAFMPPGVEPGYPPYPTYPPPGSQPPAPGDSP